MVVCDCRGGGGLRGAAPEQHYYDMLSVHTHAHGNHTHVNAHSYVRMYVCMLRASAH